MKKRLLFAAAVAAVMGLMPAAPLQARVVSQAAVTEMVLDQIVEIKNGGRNFGRSHNRGRHLGWNRGRHEGWGRGRGQRWNRGRFG